MQIARSEPKNTPPPLLLPRPNPSVDQWRTSIGGAAMLIADASVTTDKQIRPMWSAYTPTAHSHMRHCSVGQPD